MQRKTVYLLFSKFTLHVSGANHTNHQELNETVNTASGTGHIFCAANSLQRGYVVEGGSCTVLEAMCSSLYMKALSELHTRTMGQNMLP